MTLASSKALGQLGIATQTAEGSGASNPTYAHPAFSGLPHPVQSVSPFPVVDADGFRQGLYKADEHWECDTVVPAFPASAGTYIKGMLPTDTKSGSSDPYTHAFTLTGTIPWETVFAKRPGAQYEKYVDGLMSELSLDFSAADPFIRVGAKFVGKTPSKLGSAYTPGTTESLAPGNEYFTTVGATLKLNIDASPATTTITNVASGTLRVTREVADVPTVDSLTPVYVYAGFYDIGCSLELVWQDYNAFAATYFGSVSGTTPSATIVSGAFDFTFPAQGNSNHSLQVVSKQMTFLLNDPPDIDPGGGAVTLTIEGIATRPATATDIFTVTLKNAVGTAY